MPVTSVTSASITPANYTKIKRSAPRKVVTGAPFTPAAQKQANAINTGRHPSRGRIIDIKA